MDEVRVDRWLSAARVFRSRTQASEACSGGHVKLNGANVKPHHALRIDDELHVQKAELLRILVVKALADKRLSAPLARKLYEDHSPPPPPPREHARGTPRRPRGEGRPTKRDRRDLDRFRGRS